MTRSVILLILVGTIIYSSLAAPKPTQSINNHQLLKKIGFTRVRSPNSHHRKRLAIESRHHTRSDDSHMFIVKLPPNPHYYVHNRPNSIDIPSSKNVPVGFKNNGKPAKIYHWNIPVIKQIVANKYKSRLNDPDLSSGNSINSVHHHHQQQLQQQQQQQHQQQHHQHQQEIDFQNPESWNEVLDKPENRKPVKPSYYVPATSKSNKTWPFMKYFPGNGKPHSFYVIEKSKKAHYHRLLP